MNTLMEAMPELDGAAGGKRIPSGELWQDREIRFDASSRELKCRAGEAVLDALEPVEDTKGNNGVHGELLITNLRVVWMSKKRRSVNISIGLGCFQSTNVMAASSRLKGSTESLSILTKMHKNRFEFVFTSLGRSAQQLQQAVKRVFAAYDQTRLYRDVKLRGALLTDGELNTLPYEQTYSKVNGVWNLSSGAEGNLGSFFVSNARVVWYSHTSDNYNVSIPYLQMTNVRLRNSKAGPAVVLETSASSGGFILGFKIDPEETLAYVIQEVSALWKAYTQQPFMGVDCEAMASERDQALASARLQSQEEDVEVINHQGDVLAAYYADANQGKDREPVFCEHLGLAIERPREGTSAEQLWSVL